MLGDQAYDFQKEEGSVGNDYMKFIKSITSKVPFQVKIIFNVKINF